MAPPPRKGRRRSRFGVALVLDGIRSTGSALAARHARAVRAILTRGFAIESAALLLAAAAGAAIGWSLAEALLTAVADVLGLGALFFTSPDEVLLVHLKPAVAMVLPSLAAWIALALYRARSGLDPSSMRVALYVAVPWVAALAAEGARIAWLRTAFAIGGDTGAAPALMISALDVLPGGWAMRSSVLSGGVMWILALVPGPRGARAEHAARAEPPPAGPQGP